MSIKSLTLRLTYYFQLMALSDELWNRNFRTEQTLNKANIFLIGRLFRIIELLELLAQQSSRLHQYDSLPSEHSERTPVTTRGKT